jgi:hypothetical protein
MGSVAQLEALQREVLQRLSDAEITVDAPDTVDGSWFIDFGRAGRVATVEWRPSFGFGISAPGGAYGEGPDRVLADPRATAEYIVRMLDRPEQSVDQQISAILKAMENATAHVERVMRQIASEKGVQLPPSLRNEMRSATDDVKRVESELMKIAESLAAGRQRSGGIAVDEMEN